MKIDYLKIGLFSWLLRLLRTGVMSGFGLSLILTFSFALSYAQPATKSFSYNNAEAIKKSILDEKILLISDRKIYLCGENIVFEAFTYEANWFLPIVSSSILYVELYNQQNVVITQGKFYLKNGRCSGVISIPRDIKSDVYYIRAYSNYMKNFGVQQFFIQKLKIVNPFLNNPVSFLPSDTQKVFNCHIFPEGGNLVSGIKSKVGCRFTDQFGKGVEVSARVRDTNNITITSFKTYRDGFGIFDLIPKAGVSYQLEATSGMSNFTKPMPKPLISGVTLSIDTLTIDFLRLRIIFN